MSHVKPFESPYDKSFTGINLVDLNVTDTYYRWKHCANKA